MQNNLEKEIADRKLEVHMKIPAQVISQLEYNALWNDQRRIFYFFWPLAAFYAAAVWPWIQFCNTSLTRITSKMNDIEG